MDDAFRVRRRQAVGCLQGIVNRFALRQRRAIHPLAQGLAFQQFRNDIRRAIVRADVKDDQDVRMIERAGRPLAQSGADVPCPQRTPRAKP